MAPPESRNLQPDSPWDCKRYRHAQLKATNKVRQAQCSKKCEDLLLIASDAISEASSHTSRHRIRSLRIRSHVPSCLILTPQSPWLGSLLETSASCRQLNHRRRSGHGSATLPVEMVLEILGRVGDLPECVRFAKSGLVRQLKPEDSLKIWGNWPCEYLLYQ